MECMDGMLAVSRSRISLLLGFSSVVSIVVLAFQGLHGNLLKCWTLPHCCDNPFVHQLWQIAVFVYDHAPLALLSSQIKLGTLIWRSSWHFCWNGMYEVCILARKDLGNSSFILGLEVGNFVFTSPGFAFACWWCICMVKYDFKFWSGRIFTNCHSKQNFAGDSSHKLSQHPSEKKGHPSTTHWGWFGAGFLDLLPFVTRKSWALWRLCFEQNFLPWDV